jgi:hypothetical protein
LFFRVSHRGHSLSSSSDILGQETPGIYARGNADPGLRGRAIPSGVSGGGYLTGMSRFRLLPTPAQEVLLVEHCRHARFVWNLAVEQQQLWQPGRRAPGYNRRARTRLAIAKLKARETNRRKDWVEKTTTDLARRFATIRVENLDVLAMTRSARGTVEKPGVRVAQKRGLNRAIRSQGWGRLVARLDHKAAGRLAVGRSVNCEPQLGSPAA